MKIGSVLENHKIEKRISITPDIVKKYTSLGFEILLSENYGHHIGINNDEYKKLAISKQEETEELVSKLVIKSIIEILKKKKISTRNILLGI